ncbi:MAG: hypothetical protein HY393_01945 [Candidatus Diapherotrites archaeon]|nr:hypothetical protein [Candidatus Diapherotrites archaeon]
MHLHIDHGIVAGKAGQKLVIDPSRKSHGFSDAIVTHAHSDHALIGANACTYHLTEATRDLVAHKIPKKGLVQCKEWKRAWHSNGMDVELHSAGHILGSSQVALNDGEERAVVTSDFKLQDSIIQKGAEPLECDTLVIETTFGLPCFSFPPREQVYHEMGSWIRRMIGLGQFVVLAGYATGKAQELTAVCNEYAGEIPVVHERIFSNNQVYDRHGARLGDFLLLNHNLKDANVAILPPTLATPNVLQALSFSLNRPVSSALATGWNFKQHFDRIFPLSDHADFAQLLEYVERSRAKRVLCMHGYAREFAGYVHRRKGIASRALEGVSQTVLEEFSVHA